MGNNEFLLLYEMTAISSLFVFDFKRFHHAASLSISFSILFRKLNPLFWSKPWSFCSFVSSPSLSISVLPAFTNQTPSSFFFSFLSLLFSPQTSSSSEKSSYFGLSSSSSSAVFGKKGSLFALCPPLPTVPFPYFHKDVLLRSYSMCTLSHSSTEKLPPGRKKKKKKKEKASYCRKGH